MGSLGYRHTKEARARISEAARRPRPRMTIAERLDRLSEPEPMSGCRLWVGHVGKNGYGTLEIAPGKVEYVHRLAFQVAHGPIPEDKPFVCHRCDVQTCLAPYHLFAGTQLDNMLDANAKGRLLTAQLHTAEAEAKAVATRRARDSYGNRRGATNSEETRQKIRDAWARWREAHACTHSS